MKLYTPIATLAVAGLALMVAPKAQAAPILVFGQTGTVDNLVITTNGTTANLSIVNAPISVSQIAGGVPATAFAATMNLSASSVGPATVAGGSISEAFSGTFSVTSALCAGGNCLSGTFTDLLDGLVGGHSVSLDASTPPASDVTFTSTQIPAGDLGLDRAMSLSFSNLTNGLALSGTTVNANAGTVAGNFSAGIVPTPEPASLALLGVGLLGVGFVARRKRG